MHERSIRVIYSLGRKQQMEFLSEKYENLYNKYNKISEIIKYISRASMFLFMLSILTIANTCLLSAHPNWILKGSCIMSLVLSVISYIVKEYFIDIKCSEYAWHSNVTYGTIVRNIERLEKQLDKNSLVLKGNKLYYGKESRYYLVLAGNVPPVGDVVVSIRPYENVHAWMAEPM